MKLLQFGTSNKLNFFFLLTNFYWKILYLTIHCIRYLITRHINIYKEVLFNHTHKYIDLARKIK